MPHRAQTSSRVIDEEPYPQGPSRGLEQETTLNTLHNPSGIPSASLSEATVVEAFSGPSKAIFRAFEASEQQKIRAVIFLDHFPVLL